MKPHKMLYSNAFATFGSVVGYMLKRATLRAADCARRRGTSYFRAWALQVTLIDCGKVCAIDNARSSFSEPQFGHSMDWPFSGSPTHRAEIEQALTQCKAKTRQICANCSFHYVTSWLNVCR